MCNDVKYVFVTCLLSEYTYFKSVKALKCVLTEIKIKGLTFFYLKEIVGITVFLKSEINLI